MIQRYILVMFVFFFFLRYLVKGMGVVGQALALTIEGLCLLTLMIVLYQVARGRQLLVSTKYVILFILFVVATLVGAVANDVQPGAVLSGVRNVYMYLPFFLLPLIFAFTEKEFSQQLKVISIFAVVQIPLVLMQYSIGTIGGTMDHVYGTLMISSYLSIFLVGCVSIVWASFLAKNISLLKAIILMLLFLAPTTMNETKGTLLLLPFGFLVPSLVLALQQRNYKMLVMSVVIIVGMGGLFLSLFSVLLSDLQTADLGGFFLEGGFVEYLYSGIDEDTPRDFGVLVDVGRIDAIIYALNNISKDVVNLFFGFGIGNVSEAASGLIEGDFKKFEHLAPQMSTMSLMLWEVGLIGLIIVVVGCVYIMKDAYALAGMNSPYSWFARGWVGIAVIFFFVLPYKNILISDVNFMLFWYFSGVVVAEKIRAQKKLTVVHGYS